VKGHGDDRLRLAGTRGIAEYREDSGVTVLGEKGSRRLDRLPARRSVFSDFVLGAYAGGKPELTWREIVKANEYALAAHEASETGAVVKIA